MRPVRLRPLGLPLLAAALLSPAGARAGDGTHPRTPVEWPEDTPCMTVVDRSVQSTLHFPYGIPYEDTMLTEDELPTSRRHQFLALCRNYSPQDPLPTWISLKDVDDWNAWLAMFDVDPLVLEPDEVMDTHSIYSACTHRITPDDARRPITLEEAAKGVDWDTTGLPAGAYVVHGYNWEPGINVWYKRPGVVHVVDGPDLAAVGPAAALMNKEDYMGPDETLELQGCARALPGSTLTAYWSLTGPEGLQWIPFAEGVALEGDVISIPYTPAPEAVGQTVALRVDVTDPMQRTFSTFPVQLVVVLKNPVPEGTTGCSDSGSFIGNASCGGDDSGSSGDGSTGGSTGTGGPASTGEDSGTAATGGTTGAASATTAPVDPGAPESCGCRSRGVGGSWAWTGLLLLGLRRGRGRRALH